MMYGQMTAGSWIYIGTQGIVQGTYETFVEAGRRHYGGTSPGKWILTAGLGGMGGAQPLAAAMAGASCLAIECQIRRSIELRLRTSYLDERADHARRRADRSSRAGRMQASDLSRACSATPRRFFPEIYRRGIRPDRHRSDLRARPDQWLFARRSGASPNGGRSASAIPKALSNARRARRSRIMSRAMLDFYSAGVPTLDYGNNIRQVAKDEGVADAFDFPGLRAGLYPPAVLPRRWTVPLGGALWRSGGHLSHRCQGERGDPGRSASCIIGSIWRVNGSHFRSLPARICWVGLGASPPARPRLQRDGRERRVEGADRHRPRPSRFRLGRLAQPRDRSDD